MQKPKVEVDLSAMSRRFRPALMAFFLRRLRNRSEAEDLTQDVLVRVAERNETIDASRPDGYVFQIAANLLRDRGRRLLVRNAYQAGFGVGDQSRVEERDPDRVMQAEQSLRGVLNALNELPEKTRTIFVLFRLENMKQREIADMLGIAVRTVEEHVIRASVHLRERLEDER